MNINLVPPFGADGIPFSTAESILVEIFGKPMTEQKLSNTDGYLIDRRVLDYGKHYFLINVDNGLIAITVDISNSPIILWGKDVSLLSPIELQTYIGTIGYSTSIEYEPQWDEYDVMAIDCGLIASFCEGKLESIEISNPSLRSREMVAGRLG
jgi:hypothetical protein